MEHSGGDVSAVAPSWVQLRVPCCPPKRNCGDGQEAVIHILPECDQAPEWMCPLPNNLCPVD